MPNTSGEDNATSAADDEASPSGQRGAVCRFALAPPRNFLYPAILLLLAERPRHGYRLVDALLAMGFGPVDRSSVYRTLGQLAGDGLLDSWSAEPTAGSTRYVYAPTEQGLRSLELWMSILSEERDKVDAVLKRYDAILDGPD